MAEAAGFDKLNLSTVTEDPEQEVALRDIGETDSDPAIIEFFDALSRAARVTMAVQC